MLVTTLPSVCPECGKVFTRERARAACEECAPLRDIGTTRTKTRQQRGYDSAWDRLSKRARRLQPFCSDCGSPDDLTADHTVTAWQRKEQGLPIRLRDIDVVCRSCNSARGEARGDEISSRRLEVDKELAEARAALDDDSPDHDFFLSD